MMARGIITVTQTNKLNSNERLILELYIAQIDYTCNRMYTYKNNDTRDNSIFYQTLTNLKAAALDAVLYVYIYFFSFERLSV